MSFSSPTAALFAATLLVSSASAQIAFTGPTQYPLVGLRPDSVATGDFDHANGIDFAVASSHLSSTNGPDRVEIFQNQGNGVFVPGQVILLGNNLDAGAIVSGDVDLDGDLDLAVALKNPNTVQVLINNGGTFVLGVSSTVAASEPAHMAIADVDGDGDLDLVTSNRSSNNLSVLKNGGAGNMTFFATIPVGLDPRGLALDDLNGDNRTDIAVASHDSRRLDVFFNLGSGNFGPATSLTVAGNEKPSGVVAADLDADGDVDLATTTDNNNVGIVVVLRNAGNGTFSSATFLSNGLNPGAIVAGDFDADGDKDLATTDEDANRVSVLPNLGNANFGAAAIFNVGTFPEGLARADFDGNGSLDLVVANRDSNNVSVLTNVTAGGTDNFCVTTPNSAGFGARIDSTGSLSIAANSFTLLARGAPANTTGLFFYGSTTTFAPFNNGIRCVGSPLVRLSPALTTDASGHAVRPVNFAQLAIAPGSTKYVQFWHRDLPAGGAQSDVSDALRATFTP